MSDNLNDVYKGMLEEKAKKRDITSSTVDVITKSHAKAPIVLDFEAELFGLSPEEVKKLPIQSVEMLQKALVNLVSKTKEDPMLRQALRRFINNTFTTLEKEEMEKKADKKAVKESTFKDILDNLSESTKARQFNWKKVLDIDERRINDPVFISLLETFQLNETLTRPQKQGVMFFLKKLAELAESNTQIALALTKLVRFENIQGQSSEVMESKIESDIKILSEGIADSDVSPSAILLTLGIGTKKKKKKDALAEIIFSYDDNFVEKNKDKKITWKTVEAAFAHNKEYLKKLFNYIVKDQTQLKMLVSKISDVIGKKEEVVMRSMKPN